MSVKSLLCTLFFSIGVVVVASLFFFFDKEKDIVENFEECVARGYSVLESYPEQCKTPAGQTFIADIGNELQKQDLIQVASPRPRAVIQSPLVISGEARGYWFFEASFPIKLLNGEGNEIAVTIAQAKSEWMTEDFVPFEATLSFTAPSGDHGMLVFQKDNPSGLEVHDDALTMPIRFR